MWCRHVDQCRLANTLSIKSCLQNWVGRWVVTFSLSLWRPGLGKLKTTCEMSWVVLGKLCKHHCSSRSSTRLCVHLSIIPGRSCTPTKCPRNPLFSNKRVCDHSEKRVFGKQQEMRLVEAWKMSGPGGGRTTVESGWEGLSFLLKVKRRV